MPILAGLPVHVPVLDEQHLAAPAAQVQCADDAVVQERPDVAVRPRVHRAPRPAAVFPRRVRFDDRGSFPLSCSTAGGVYGRRWKAEASAFNGREPDECHRNVDFGALDSFSGRFCVIRGTKYNGQVSGRFHHSRIVFSWMSCGNV